MESAGSRLRSRSAGPQQLFPADAVPSTHSETGPKRKRKATNGDQSRARTKRSVNAMPKYHFISKHVAP